ncbi:MAG: hypothetical protein WC342_04200 [Methanoregula sp.]|jgi:predicted nuclease of restriction endonuclease-like RecB superfamily
MTAVGYKNGFLPQEFPDVTGYLDEKIPTFEKSLDRYFDEHFPEIIEEWELVRETDLEDLELRLEAVMADIDTLTKGEAAFRGRVEKLRTLVDELEGKRV